jgi:dihydroorotase
LTMKLVSEGVLSLPLAIRKLSSVPASILGVPGGSLKEGVVADIAIIDLEEEYIFKEEGIKSKSKNSPFIGKNLKGRNILTIVEGRIVWSRDAEHFSGRR